ncbi:MAG: MATE family efflux transporter [Clostridia bacterium]|nr:MATE family efflux transporter [Clostridia bacterium]
MLKTLFNDKKFWRTVFTLAVPIGIQNLLTASFTLVDTLMVGQLGDVCLAAVGMAGQWSWILSVFTFGICSGASIFLAQYFGEENKRGIIHTYSVAIISGVLVSLIFMVTGLLCPEGIIRIFNKTPEVLSAGTKYLKIAAFSYPAILINLLINTVLRSTHRVKLPMVVSFFTTILNAVLDYGLIFGAFGLPQMGIEGAAVATVISAWSGPVIILFICALYRDEIFYAPVKEFFGFDFSFVKKFYKRSFPVILNEVMWGMGFVAYNALFSNMGYEYTAAISILRTFENIAISFFVGLTNAACVIVGKDIGSGEIEKGVLNAKRFMIFVPLVSVLISGIIIVFRTPLVGIFNMGNSISEKTLACAKSIMLIYALETPVRNIPYVGIVGIFRSGGDTKKSMQYDLLTLWCVAVPITFIAALVFKLPFLAVFLCSYISEDYLKAFLCIRYFRSKKWIKPITETGKKALAEYLKAE